MHGPVSVASVPGFNQSAGLARSSRRSTWMSCEVIWSLGVPFTVPAASALSCEDAVKEVHVVVKAVCRI